jgi:hypothetical protein
LLILLRKDNVAIKCSKILSLFHYFAATMENMCEALSCFF